MQFPSDAISTAKIRKRTWTSHERPISDGYASKKATHNIVEGNLKFRPCVLAENAKVKKYFWPQEKNVKCPGSLTVALTCRATHNPPI